jgi:Cytochrome P460
MLRSSLLLLLAFLLPQNKNVTTIPAAVSDGPAYTAAGELKFPEAYREWVFLASSTDMSYDPKPTAVEHTVFNNLFVNPSAYKAFLATGTWPDKTMLVLENRAGEAARSINTQGRTQSVQVTGMEVHVKDASLAGGWGFFSFDNMVSAKLTPRPASCYTCHEQHAAVDTTFVQFYPTLIELAKKKGTLSAAYLKESVAASK